MSDEKKMKVSFDGDFAWAIAFLFWIFWMQGGWYRIDCAIGVQKACQLISAEKGYAEVQK